MREREKRWKQRERKKERKQELLFSRERARANRSSGETLRIACCIFRAAQRRAVAFQSTRARRLKSGRFGNITVLIHGTYSCNHLEKERDACSVPTQPLAETMPVETIDNVAAGIFLLVLRRTFACPMRILPKKRSEAALLAAFPISADVKGIDAFSAQRAKTKVSFGTFQCDSGPTETSPLFFSSSLFSLRRTCAHVVAQTRTVPKRREAALALEGGMMKGSSRRKGAERAVFLLIIPLFDKEEEATCVEESTCLLSFFEFPFVACCLFLLFSRFVPTSATIAFFFFFLASRSRALAYIFEKGFSLAVPVAFYIAADDKGERSVNRTRQPERKP